MPRGPPKRNTTTVSKKRVRGGQAESGFAGLGPGFDPLRIQYQTPEKRPGGAPTWPRTADPVPKLLGIPVNHKTPVSKNDEWAPTRRLGASPGSPSSAPLGIQCQPPKKNTRRENLATNGLAPALECRRKIVSKKHSPSPTGQRLASVFLGFSGGFQPALRPNQPRDDKGGKTSGRSLIGSIVPDSTTGLEYRN
ncbi:hypothetical protein JTE90_014533 [Oedothorax gibbosus]|uniref:Uncharacterized protein n=1 Tax=Oedothorax gibbosus TaxID=931172 RepID=A0AAV6TKM4_9ARAC|nr:hypothetical protein JTE90_014533 [Oedothorax gibbosus]